MDLLGADFPFNSGLPQASTDRRKRRIGAATARMMTKAGASWWSPPARSTNSTPLCRS